MTDIFISYRRSGGREIARTVYLALGKLGYQNIFFDYNSLRNGVFNEQIIDAINECKDFILILTDSSMDRCANDDDWVRKEITTAINAGCNIIPLKIDDQFKGFPLDFPRNLNIIKMIQQSTLLTNEYFDDSIRHITERLESKPVQSSTNVNLPECQFILKIRPDETCEFLVDGERISKIKANKHLLFKRLIQGSTYQLEFKSLASKDLSYSVSYIVPKMKNEDEIQVSFSKLKEERAKLTEEIEKQKKEERKIRQLQKESLRNMLKMYNQHDIKAYNERTLVCKDNKYGYVDTQGLEIIPCVYDDALHFSEELACVLIDGKWEYINIYGNVAVQISSNTPSYCTNGLIVYSHGNKYGIIDKEGNTVVECIYDYISQPNNHIYAVKQNNKYFYINSKGNRINQFSYDEIPFNKVGIRIEGNRAKHELYTHASEDNFLLSSELPGKVILNKKYGYINKSGDQIFPCIANELDFMFRSLEHNSPIKANVNGKWGAFDSESGKIMIPFMYSLLHECGRYSYDDFSIGKGFNPDPIIYVAKENTIIKDNEYPYWMHVSTNTLGALAPNGSVLIPLEYNFIYYDINYWAYVGIVITNKKSYTLSQIIRSFIQEEYHTQQILNKISYRADYFRLLEMGDFYESSMMMSEFFECGIKTKVQNFYLTQENDQEITDTRDFDSTDYIEITDKVSSKNKFDRLETLERADYSIAYKGDYCAVYDNIAKKLLTNFCFTVLKLSELERYTDCPHDHCSFNFAVNGYRGSFSIEISPENRIYINRSLLKFQYTDDDIKKIFQL